MTLSYLGLVIEFVNYPSKVRSGEPFLPADGWVVFDIGDLGFRIKSVSLTTRPPESGLDDTIIRLILSMMLALYMVLSRGVGWDG